MTPWRSKSARFGRVSASRGPVGPGNNASRSSKRPDTLRAAHFARDADEIRTTGEAIIETLGAEQLVDAAAVVAHFDAINRVADAAGIELDKPMQGATSDLREHLGFNEFDTGAN